MAEWEPKRITVDLPDDLSVLAGGVKVVTCRYLGPTQQGKIDLDIQVETAEKRNAAGEDWAHKMVQAVGTDAESIDQQEARIEKKKHEDPVEWALDRWPQGLVCKHAIKAFDGTKMSHADIEDWLNQGPAPSVTRYIAMAVMVPSDLIPENEKRRGEDSGALSAA